jgi:hypothetical protein
MSARSSQIAAPFESWPFCTQTALFTAMLATVIVVKILMKQNGRVLPSGIPGFVALQKAGSAEKAQAILTGWGADGRRAARRDLWLDLGLVLGYAVGLSVAFSSAVSGVDAAASGCWASAARLFAWVPLLAGAVDLAENGCLAATLASYKQDNAKKLGGWPHAASVLSKTKWVLLGLSAGWALLVLWPLLVP